MSGTIESKPHLIDLKNSPVINNIKTIDNKMLVIEDCTMILTKSLIKTDKPEI